MKQIIINIDAEGKFEILSDIDPYTLIGVLTAAQIIIFNNSKDGADKKPQSKIITLPQARIN